MVVAGAGPAGTAAALVLARAGCSVAIVDRRTFPRDKVCGDLLGSEAVATLARLGLAEVLDGALPLDGAVLHGPRGTVAGAAVRAQLRAPDPADARVLTRREFDARLLERARAAGAAFIAANVAGVLRAPGGAVAGVRTSAGDVRAAVTIGAEGWGSPVARALGVRAPARPLRAVTLRAYASGVADLERRMHFFVNARGDGYGWLFPLPGGLTNVGLGFIAHEPGSEDAKRAFERFTGPASPARALLANASFDRPAAWPIPLGWRGVRAAAAGALLAGDAAALASPLSGSGIGNALESGAAAANFALRALAGDRAAWRGYSGWLRRRFALRLRLERFAHDVAGTAGGVELWLALVNAVPGAGALLSRALLALG